MSWVRIWVHLVFCTKNKVNLLATPELRFQIFNHMRENASEKEIFLDCVSGYSDHAHCLILLGRNQTISKVSQLIKGESSHWINNQKILDYKFAWQDDYWAVGVSESHVDRVRKYIHNQEKHHRKVTFKEEIDRFVSKYGFEKVSDIK